MIALLGKLKLNLDKPEGAMYMTKFRQLLNEVWKDKDVLSEEKIFLISAVEEVIRGKKWRELKTGQIKILEHIVRQIRDKTLSQKKMNEALREIHSSGMDIFPSSKIDEDDE
ncbi:MAG: hypothetical protein ACC630_00215 [Nitrospinota bacterium]